MQAWVAYFLEQVAAPVATSAAAEPQQVAEARKAERQQLLEARRPSSVMTGTKLSVADYAALGVRRVSVGGVLALTAWSAVMRAASRLADFGSFEGFAARPSLDLNTLFGESSTRSGQP